MNTSSYIMLKGTEKAYAVSILYLLGVTVAMAVGISHPSSFLPFACLVILVWLTNNRGTKLRTNQSFTNKGSLKQNAEFFIVGE